MWFVYIVECKNGAFYTGLTNDVDRRVKMHNAGRGARYTRIFGPVRLKYFEEFEERIDAMRREWAIKKLERKHKRHLIKSGLGKKR